MFSFPALLNIQVIGKCFLVLPGNETLDPAARILGAPFSIPLMVDVLLAGLCSLEKMIDFLAKPIGVSLLAFVLNIWVTLVNLLNWFKFFLNTEGAKKVCTF